MAARFEVLSPEGQVVSGDFRPRRPVTDLNRAVIAELWDDRFYGDEIFAEVRAGLRARFPGVRFVEHQVFGNTHGVDEAETIGNIPQILTERGCNAVLSAVGA